MSPFPHSGDNLHTVLSRCNCRENKGEREGFPPSDPSAETQIPACLFPFSRRLSLLAVSPVPSLASSLTWAGVSPCLPDGLSSPSLHCDLLASPQMRPEPAQPVCLLRAVSLCPLASGTSIFNFTIYLLPSQLRVVTIVSMDGLLVFKSAFAVLCTQVHVKKRAYNTHITRPSLPPEAMGLAAGRKGHTSSWGGGARPIPLGQVCWGPHIRAIPMSTAP